MSALLDLLGYSDTKYPSDTVQSKYTPWGTVGQATHPDPRWAGLNPTRVDEMPSPVLHPLPIDLVKSYTEDWTPSATEKLLKELEQRQNSGDIDAYKKSVISLYAGTKEHERNVSRKSSAIEAFHRVTPLHNVEEHERAHVVLSNPKFSKAYKEVGEREGFNTFIGHNLEEAVIRHMEQAPDIKSILKDYAAIGMPIINDPNIWKNSDPTLSIADSAAGNKRLNAISGLMYDHVSGPEGRSPYSKYKEMPREEAVAHLAYRAEKLHRAVGEVLENVPLVVEEMESKEAVQKFAEGGFVQTGPKLTGEPTAQALAGGLATLGRYGDDYMVHAAEGETIIPAEVLQANPGLKNDIFRQMQAMGIEEPSRYVVGSEFNSINPLTGQPEFFFKKIFKAIKKILPMALPIVGNLIAPGIGGIVGSALGTAISGGGASDILKNVLLTGGTQALMGGLGSLGKSGQSFLGGAKQSLGQIFRSPTAAFQEGIFGAPAVPQPAASYQNPSDIPSIQPRNMTTTGYGETRPVSQPVYTSDQFIDTKAGRNPTTGLGVGEVGKTPGGNWFSNLGRWGQAGVVGGGLGLGAFALDALDEDENGEPGEGVSGDPQVAAYDKYLALPPSEKNSPLARKYLQIAGVGPAFTRSRLPSVTGIPSTAAGDYLSSTYNVADGGAINGPGTGTSDSIPALLSDGEFVMTADAVRGAGGGNRQQGAARMYDMMQQFERVA